MILTLLPLSSLKTQAEESKFSAYMRVSAEGPTKIIVNKCNLSGITNIDLQVDKGSLTISEYDVTKDSGSLPEYKLLTDVKDQHQYYTVYISSGSFSNEQLKKLLEDKVRITADANKEQKISISFGNGTMNLPTDATITKFSIQNHVDGDSGVHYYMYIKQSSTQQSDDAKNVLRWDEAYNKAKSYRYNGMVGYLATVTSQEEDQALDSISLDGGWSGGARFSVKDDDSITYNRNDDKFKAQTTDYIQNPYWTWQCGPEAGVIYYVQTSKTNGNFQNGSAYQYTSDAPSNAYNTTKAAYTHWSSKEPNNNNQSSNTNSYKPDEQIDGFNQDTNYESCMQLHYYRDGTKGESKGYYWNDITNAHAWDLVQGYFVEFSGYKHDGNYTTESFEISYGNHNFVYTANQDTITAACDGTDNDNCTYKLSPVSVKLSAQDQTWALSPIGKAAIFSNMDFTNFNTVTGKSLSKDDIKLYAASDTNRSTELTELNGVGNYLADLTVEGQTATCNVSVTPGTDTWSYSANGSILTATCNGECGQAGSHTESLILSASSQTYSNSLVNKENIFKNTDLASFNLVTGLSLSYDDIKIYAANENGEKTDNTELSGTILLNGYYLANITVSDQTATVIFEVNKDAPIIDGIDNDMIYCQATEFTVTDDYLDTVKIDDEIITPTEGKYILPADGISHTVTATDTLGITTTIRNVKANDGHIYDRELAKDECLKQAANCQSRAIYYKSCRCGAIGTETFENGTYGDHDYSIFIQEVPATNSSEGTKAHYECSICHKNFDTNKSELNDLTITYTNNNNSNECNHSFDREVVSDEYLESAATCHSKAVYYKSCQCGAKGTDTFTYGECKEHDYSGNWTIIKEATATEEGIKETYCKYGCGSKKTEAIAVINLNEEDSSNGNLIKDALLDANLPIESASISSSKSSLLAAAGIFSETEKNNIANGQEAKVFLRILNIDKSQLDQESQKAFETQAFTSLGSNTAIEYIDVSLFKQLGNSDAVCIHEPGTNIEISFKIPNKLIINKAGFVRKYRILRLHEGMVNTIEGNFDYNTKEFTFSTDRFSTYAIAYTDEKMGLEIWAENNITTLYGLASNLQLYAKVTPFPDANQAVTYKSNNENIITVDASGKVTAIGNGTAIITVTTIDGSLSDTISITVNCDTTGNVISPKTADTNNPLFYFLLSIATLGLIVYSLLNCKKEK